MQTFYGKAANTNIAKRIKGLTANALSDLSSFVIELKSNAKLHFAHITFKFSNKTYRQFYLLFFRFFLFFLLLGSLLGVRFLGVFHRNYDVFGDIDRFGLFRLFLDHFRFAVFSSNRFVVFGRLLVVSDLLLWL